MLDYDIIGFQTKNYALAFLDYIVRELNGNVEPDGFVYALGKRTRVQHFPISIETDEFSKLSSKAKNSNHIQRLVKSLGEEKLIVGVDRLDYSKGLIKRFQAYEHLLKNYPANIKKTTFLQISPTSRGDVSKYKQLRRDLETKAGHINGTFADFDWTPINDTSHQSFHITAVNPGCVYYRAWMWNAKLPWHFKHDLAHECIVCDLPGVGEDFERYNYT